MTNHVLVGISIAFVQYNRYHSAKAGSHNSIEYCGALCESQEAIEW